MVSIGIIVWVIQAVNYLDFMVEDGHSFQIYISYSILNFPKIYIDCFLCFFFISLIYNLIKYENNNELMILDNWDYKKKFIDQILIYSFFICFFQICLELIFRQLPK